MSAQHTPGPWANDGLVIAAGKPRRWIASVACDPDSNAIAERRANIDLMTAAPDLLCILTRPGGVMWMAEQWLASKGENWVNQQDFEERFSEARAAIAKATGAA